MKDPRDRFSFPDGTESKGTVRGKFPGKKKQTPTSDGERVLVAFLEKASESIRYISRHVKKEHFISQVSVLPGGKTVTEGGVRYSRRCSLLTMATLCTQTI